MDISGLHSGWKSSKPNWSKKCCNKSNNQAVIPPPSDVSEKDIKTINEQIGLMSGMKLVRFSNCIEIDLSNYNKAFKLYNNIIRRFSKHEPPIIDYL